MGQTLVPSDRVEGAPICGRDGKKLGTIERLMLDKATGTVAYAVVRAAAFSAPTSTTTGCRGARCITTRPAGPTRPI